MWKKLYEQKKITAEKAVSMVKSGDRVIPGDFVCVCRSLLDAMVRNKDRYQNVEFMHMDPRDPVDYFKPELARNFRHLTMFCGVSNREAVNSGAANFIPGFFFTLPEIIRTQSHPDVMFLRVTPPDKNGYCSYGIQSANSPASVKVAKLVIAEVNDQMPYTFGSLIHVSEIDYLVEASYPMVQVPSPKIGDVEMQIGEICASLIEDGSTLQVGVGNVPEATLQGLKKQCDLGVHTELLGDGIIDLIEAGVITNRKKTLNPGKCIATIYMGTNKLYDYIDRNPRFELLPVDYTNNPQIIAQNDKMVSINTCLQVDLLGQINSETLNGRQFSGIGGQVDYVRGATMSKGGKSIIALSSTAARGTVSKIVPSFEPGTVVTTSRTDVDYVVTEYGYARLRGMSLRERAKALISIAHPDFKAQLTEEFERAHFKL